MKMQDKEFDDLFRSKLDDFEAEPTGQVWDGIVEGLDGKRRYKSLVPFLSIAASIIVLAAAGILFIPQKTTVITRHPDKSHLATVTKPVNTSPANKPDTRTVQHPDIIKQAPTSVNRLARVKSIKTNPSISVKNANQVAGPESVAAQAEQPVLAAVQHKQEVITPVVPDNSTSLITKTVDETPVFTTKSALTASTVPAASKQDPAPVKAKRRAHGIGGLLNAVIATVDKRKDKLIEFTDSDDDETNVISINLSALKSKSESDR